MARDDNNEQAVTYNIPRNYFTKGRIGDVISPAPPSWQVLGS